MNSLKEAFQQINTGNMEVLQGKVIQENPLEIQMAGDEKYIVSEEVTAVPEHLRNYETTVVMPSDTGKFFSGKITVKNALKKGDDVYVLASAKGKQFLVLGRV